MSLRAAPPRPTLHRVAPAYPRVLAVGALLLAGCGGIVDKEPAQQQPQVQKTPDGGASETTPPEPPSAGGIAYPYDGGTEPPTTPPDTGVADTGPEETSVPDPAGDIAYPYDDAGTATPSDPAPVDAGPAPKP